MRKTIIILLLAVMAAPLGLLAQDSPQAFFVYRNDSGINVFFYNNVDSVTCSKFDTDSILHDDYVTQDVWTRDSVFRIPLAAIDSVAFKPLPTIYKEDVKVIKDDLLSYVVKVDSLTLCLSKNVPESVLPEKGDKIVTTTVNDVLPNGFLGTVESIRTENDTVKISCGKLFLEDAFIQYYSIRTTDLYNIQEQATGKNLVRNSNSMLQKEPVTFTISHPVIGFFANKELSDHIRNVYGLSFENSLNITITPVGNVQSALILQPNLRFEVTVYYTNKSKIDWNWNLAGNLAVGKEVSLLSVPFELPLGCGVNCYVDIGAGFSLEGQMAADFSLEQKIDASCFVKYGNLYPEGNTSKLSLKEYQIIPHFKQINAVLGKVSGSAYGFFDLGIDFISKKLAKLGVKIQVGPKLELSIPMYIKETELSSRSTSNYKTMMEDNKLSLDLEGGASLDVYLLEDMKPSWDIGMSIPFGHMNFGNFYYKNFVPEFPLTYFKHDKNGKNAIRTQISSDLVLPITIGTVVFDNKSNEYQKILYDEKYQNQTSFGEYEIELSNLELNRKYTAYPMIEWFGQTLLAEPLTDFSLTATPVTTDVMDVGPKNAVLAGRVDGEVDMLGADSRYGFMYGKGDDPSSTGAAVYGNLDKDGTLTAGLAGLEPETKYYFCAFLLTGGEYYYGETKSFETEKKTEEAVDLGLSVKWRGWNLGANSPEECGGYYSWGEIEEKPEYTWGSYFDNPYGDTGDWVGCTVNADISGTERDAATVKLGEPWRVPTKEEMQELVDKCQWEWTSSGGMGGYKVTGPSGKSIFLPAAGSIDGTDVGNKGSYGGYWTSTPNTAGSNSQAGNLYFFGNTLRAVQWSNRYAGRSIRPVIPY